MCFPILQNIQMCSAVHDNPVPDRVALDVLGAGDEAEDGGAVVQAQALPHAGLHCSALYSTALFCTVQYCTCLYCTVQYYTVMIGITHHYNALQCPVLPCTEISSNLEISSTVL